MREYYHEEHLYAFNLDFYEKILLRTLYKILHLLLLFKKSHYSFTIQIYEECLKIFYEISLTLFNNEES